MASLNGTQNSRSSMGSHDRKIRYMNLLEDLSIIEERIGHNVDCMDKTAAAVQEAQLLLVEGGVEERVKHPGEGYLDSRVLRATSDLAIRCSEAISGNINTYDKHDLALHIQENPDFWNFSLPREVPTIAFLFGTFDATPPEQRPRAQRSRQERQQALALKAPDNVDKLDKEEEGSEMVSRAFRFINKLYRQIGRPLSYFHLVLDPNSFSNTVENIYQVSFLVRDAMLMMKIDDKFGLPFVTPVTHPQKSEGPRDIAEENQFVISIDMKRWQELIKAFKIKKPMMQLKRH